MRLTKKNSGIKCKTGKTRKETFKLILILCKNDPKNIRNIFQNYLSVLIKGVKQTSDSEEKINK
jgi:hypothetical protein